MQVKSGIPTAASDIAEQPAMLELQRTYGKTIHTWAFDIHPNLPLGPPSLMMSYTKDGQGPPEHLVKTRDEKYSMNTESKRRLRADYLPQYAKSDDADQWEKNGKGIVFEAKERDLRL